jgi:hypothetical protein
MPWRNRRNILELRRQTEENHNASLTDVSARLEPNAFRNCVEGYPRTDLKD